MQVSLVYLAANEKGEGVWVSEAKPLSFTLKAGEEMLLTKDGSAIHSSRVRVLGRDAHAVVRPSPRTWSSPTKPYQAAQPSSFPLVFGGK